MVAVGQASFIITPKVQGLQKEIADNLFAPIKKSSSQLSDDISKSIASGVDKATRDVEAAMSRQANASKNLEKALSGVEDAQSRRVEVLKKEEAAAKNLDAIRSKAARNEQSALENLEKVRKDSKSTSEDILSAERKLQEVRTKGNADILRKEAQYEAAQRASAKSARDLTSAQEKVTKANNKVAEAEENVISAQKRLNDSNKKGEKSTGLFDNALKKLGLSAKKTSDDLDDAAKKGSSFGEKLSKGLKTMGTGALLAVGAKAGTAVIDGMGTAIDKGMGRLQSKEQANTLLAGLGFEEKSISNVMDNALESVKGTSFALGEAAQAAATFAGAGVQEGEDMVRILKLVGDTAAITGTNFGEMSSIWTKISANQKLTTEELNQLQDRGVGILTKIQEEYGVTADEARKMISSGEIGFEEFADIMEKTLGGAALKTGETFSGSMSNMQSALGRVGEALLSPGFQNAPMIFSLIGRSADKLTESLGPVMEDFSEWLGPKIEQFVEDSGPKIEEFFGGLGETLANFAKGTGKDIFGGVIAGFNILWDYSSQVFSFIKSILPELGDIFNAVGKGIADALGDIFSKPEGVQETTSVFEKLSGVVRVFVEFLASHKETISSIVSFAVKLAPAILAVQVAMSGLSNVILPVVNVLKVIGPILSGIMGVIKPLFALMAANPIGAVVVSIGALVTGLTYFFTQTEKGKEVWKSFTDFLQSAWDGFVQWITPFFSWFADQWNSLKDVLADFGAAVGEFWTNHIQPFIDWLVDAFKMVIQVFLTVLIAPIVIQINLIKDVVIPALATVVQWLWDSVINPVITWIADKWTWLQEIISGVVEFVKTKIYEFGNKMMELWTSFITPVIDWIVGKWTWLQTTISNVVAFINTKIGEFGAKMMELWTSYITPVLDWIGNKWTWLQGLISGIIDAIKTKLQEFANKVQELWLTYVQPLVQAIGDKWTWLKDSMVQTYQTIKSNVIDAFTNALTNFKNHVGTVVEGIKTTWNKLKSIFAKPAKFFVDTVYNKGIVPVWNKVAEWTGLDELSPAPLGDLGNYATGGVLPGYTPGRDVYDLYDPVHNVRIGLSGGEAILRPEVVRAMGGSTAIDALNRAAITGGAHKVGRNLGEGAQFAKGGVIDLGDFKKGGDPAIERDIERAKRFAQAQHGLPYQFGGVGNPSWDCSGLWSGIVQELNAPGTGMSGNRLFNTESNFSQFGFTPGLTGRVTIGVLSGMGGGANGHMSGTIDGVNIESASDPKGVQYGGSAWGADHSYYNHQYTLSKFLGKFLPGGDGGSGGGVMSWLYSMATGVIDKAKNTITSLIPEMPGIYGKLPGAMVEKTWDTFTDWIMEKVGLSSGAGAYGGEFGVSGSVESWRSMAKEAMRRNGYDANNPAQVEAMLKQIQTESGGDAKAVQKVVDVNTGWNDAQGILQVTPGTFAMYRDPTLPNDLHDPWANMNAALRYYRSTYGDDLTTTWGHGHGYSKGGIFNPRLFDTGGVWKTGTVGVNLSGADEYVFTNKSMASFEGAIKALKDLADKWAKAIWEADGSFGGQSRGNVTLTELVGKDWADKASYALSEFGRFFDTSEKGAKAAENLIKVKEESQEATDIIAEAEKELAEARKSDDKDKVTAAEKKLEEARTKHKDILKKVQDAEDALSLARHEALADLVQSWQESWALMSKTSLEARIKLAGFSQKIEDTRDLIRDTTLQLTKDRINVVASLHAMRQAEFDLRKTQVEGQLNVIKAEEELEIARRKSMISGLTGVNELSLAIDRFRETGVFSMELVTNEVVERTSYVRSAEAALASVRAQNAINEEIAAMKLRESMYDVMKQSLLTAQSTEILSLQAGKLQQQMEKMNGMDSFGATGAQRGLQGKSQRNQGIFGLIGSAIGVGLSIFTGNIPGAIAAGVGGIKSIGDIVTGDKQYKAYKNEVKQFENGLDKKQKGLLITGDVLGGLATVGGAAGAGYMFNEGMPGAYDVALGGAKVGAQIQDTMLSTLTDGIQIDMDKIDLDYNKKMHYLQKDYATKLHELEVKLMSEQLQSKVKLDELGAVKELADISKAIAESNSKKEIEALEEMARVAQDRRDEMSNIQSSILSTLEDSIDRAGKLSKEAADASKKAGNNPAEIVVEMPVRRGLYTEDDIMALFDSVNNLQGDITLRLNELENRNRVKGSTYTSARR